MTPAGVRAVDKPVQADIPGRVDKPGQAGVEARGVAESPLVAVVEAMSSGFDKPGQLLNYMKEPQPSAAELPAVGL
jgi:hypothetical protein